VNESLSDFFDRVARGADRAVGRVPTVLENPRAYPEEAFILAAIAVLVVLVVVLIVIVGVESIGTWRLRRQIGFRRRWDELAIRTGIGIAIAIGVLLAVSLVPLVPAVGGACGSCHRTEEAVAAWRADAHSGVSCYACHARPGLMGAARAAAEGGLRAVLSAATSATRAVAYEDRCLDCHEDISSGVTAGPVRMRHSDVIAAAYPCLSCHADVGHSSLEREPLPVVRSRMSTCLGCHDGIDASSDCTLCHDAPPSDTPGVPIAGTTPAPLTCEGGCHAPEVEARCVDCHGLKLPHPIDFMRQHASLSAASPSLCGRCHETAGRNGACDCHGEANVHGTFNEWFPQHGASARTSWPGGCLCHDITFCHWCHDRVP
jgi:hypothetical protein